MSLMEYSPVACIRQSSRCYRSVSLGCLPRNFPLARTMAMPSRVRMRLRTASNSAKVSDSENAPGSPSSPICWPTSHRRVGPHSVHQRIRVAKAPKATLAYDSAPAGIGPLMLMDLVFESTLPSHSVPPWQ